MALNAQGLQKPTKSRPKGDPPASAETNNNLEKPATGKTVPLQVNIDPEIRKAYRVFAAERDVDMSKLFVTMWEYYKQNHG